MAYKNKICTVADLRRGPEELAPLGPQNV